MGKNRKRFTTGGRAPHSLTKLNHISGGKIKVCFLMSFVCPVELWFIAAWLRNIALPVTKATIDSGSLKLQGLFRCTGHTTMRFLARLKEGTGTIVGGYTASTGDLECSWLSGQMNSASEGIGLREKRLKPTVMEVAKERRGGWVKILDRLWLLWKTKMDEVKTVADTVLFCYNSANLENIPDSAKGAFSLQFGLSDV